jgi:hypothetical protein
MLLLEIVIDAIILLAAISILACFCLEIYPLKKRRNKT